MKIVFLGDSIATQRAGIHYYGRQLVRRIVEAMPEARCSIVLPKRDPSIDLDQIIVPIRGWIPLHLRIRQLTSIPARVRHVQPDAVVELAHFGPFGLPNHIRRITVIHDLTPVTHPQFHNRGSVLAHRMLLPGILRKTGMIITNSHHTKKELEMRYPVKNKVEVIYPHVTVPVGDGTSEQFVRNSGIMSPYFLTVGTLEPRKDHETILAAFEKFSRDGIEASLVIAGGRGWKNETFYRKISRSPVRDKIVVTGYVTREQLWALYEHAHAFVFAPVAEGFGLPVQEAQTFGLPMILSDIPPHREIAGEGALYFQPGDVTALSGHLNQIFSNEDLRNSLSRQALQRSNFFAAERYDFKSLFL